MHGLNTARFNSANKYAIIYVRILTLCDVYIICGGGRHIKTCPRDAEVTRDSARGREAYIACTLVSTYTKIVYL